MPTCRRLATQNWLAWQRPLTEIHRILSRSHFTIDGVNATIRIAIRPPIVGWQGRTSAKHKPAGRAWRANNYVGHPYCQADMHDGNACCPC